MIIPGQKQAGFVKRGPYGYALLKEVGGGFVIALLGDEADGLVDGTVVIDRAERPYFVVRDDGLDLVEDFEAHCEELEEEARVLMAEALGEVAL